MNVNLAVDFNLGILRLEIWNTILVLIYHIQVSINIVY